MRMWIAAGVAITISWAGPIESRAVTLDGPAKPVFLYAGSRNDAGWGEAIDRARTKLESGMHLTIPYFEIGSQAEARAATEKFIKQGHNVVIGTSSAFAATFNDLARKYGSVVFINIADNVAGAPQMPNLRSVYGRSYESQYLCGFVAGENSKKANVGFLALRPSPIANWEINGYTLGVRKANPNATVHVVFTGEANADKTRAAAAALIDRGADVVGQSIDGPAAQIVAQERGVFATGHAVDLHELAPKSALCASIWVWDRYLSSEVKKITAGNWQADPSSLLGITRGGTDIACCNTVMTQQMMAKLNTERDGIIIDQQEIFAGPVADNENRERVPKGAVLVDTELWKMDWYVKGVVIDR